MDSFHVKENRQQITALAREREDCIWYLKPQSVGRDKLDTVRENEVFAGVREEHGELLRRKEALKVRKFTRGPEEERWAQDS